MPQGRIVWAVNGLIGQTGRPVVMHMRLKQESLVIADKPARRLKFGSLKGIENDNIRLNLSFRPIGQQI